MTPRKFLYRACAASVKSDTFIPECREFLCSILGDRIIPIFQQLDKKEIDTNMVLLASKQLITQHLITSSSKEEEDKLKRYQTKQEHTENYFASIYDLDGNICQAKNSKDEMEDLQKYFMLPQRAQDWADRKLVMGPSDWRGEIFHVPTNNVILIEREDSFLRIYGIKKSPVMHRRTIGGSSLKFIGKAKQDRTSFSHG
jgi:hypothetical protein